jgi:hypothetical protein
MVARKAQRLLPQIMTVAPAWVEAHCVIPDRHVAGKKFRLYDYQLEYFSNFYLVKPDVEFDPADPVLGPAFVYRRSLLVGPQKLGKGPLVAAHVCVEGVGPALFAGWAKRNDVYDCADHGCRCGWEYPYEVGEPKGMPWATPLIQITAYSEEQTGNIYDALRPMIELGPLSDVIRKTGEEFIRLPNDGRIDTVTSSAQSRLGQRITFAPQDEVGLWNKTNGMTKVADTQYRGLAGMGGRASLTSNAWDPAEMSVAQQQFESKAKDIYRQFRQPPSNLSYSNKVERRRIHRFVYADVLKQNGGHVDLDGIESEAADLIERDLPQAERFFGNKLVAGSDTWIASKKWDERFLPAALLKDGEQITLGFDGSVNEDSTGLMGCRISDGCLFKLGLWEKPIGIEGEGWQVSVGEVDARVASIFKKFDVVRMYCDPPFWHDSIDRWASEFGEKVVVQWWTNRSRAMVAALDRFHTAVMTGQLFHDGDADLKRHMMNAKVKITRDGVLIRKDRPGSPNKIDLDICAALAYEARGDAIEAGILTKKKKYRTAGF